MTITYPNGTVLKAILLSHEEREIRAVAPGCDDVLVFTRIHGLGTWISEEIDPVTIEFEWERHGVPYFYSDDCSCPKHFAARLISMVLGAFKRDELSANVVYVFSRGGTRITIQRTELRIN